MTAIITQLGTYADYFLSSASPEYIAQATRDTIVTSQPVSGTPEFSYFLMNLLALGSICLILITGGMITRHFTRQRHARQMLNILSGKAQLTAEQTSAIRDLYNILGIEEISELFDDEDIYRQAVASYMSQLRRIGLDDDRQAKAITLFQTIYIQLGFKSPSSQSAGNFLSTCQFLPGEKIALSPADDSEDIPATIIKNDVKGLVLEVKLKSAIKPGPWRGYFADHGYLWEFLSIIDALPDGRLVLRHCDNLRMLNRRLFPRIPTNRPAMVASFPLSQPVEGARIPEYMPCRVVEIAGPGLKIITEARFNIDERVMILLQMPTGTVTGGLAQVRRISQEETGKFCYAVELTGLTETELSELTCITNSIARSKKSSED